jgi:hypothetical protein
MLSEPAGLHLDITAREAALGTGLGTERYLWRLAVRPDVSSTSETTAICRPFRDGETRTRTGDTTIFRCAALFLSQAYLQGFPAISRYRVVSRFSRTLRHFAV